MKLELLLIPILAAVGFYVYPRKKAVSLPSQAYFAASINIPGDSETVYKQARADVIEQNNSIQPVTLDALFRKHGAAFGVPWQLLKAVAMRESSLNINALNEESDGAGGQASRGLMQILTPNRLNILGWSGAYPVGGVEMLFDPDKNIYYGAQILKWNLETYGLYRGIAIYNNWSQRNEPPRGPFSNQYYVDDIIDYFKQFGGDVADAYRLFGDGKKG